MRKLKQLAQEVDLLKSKTNQTEEDKKNLNIKSKNYNRLLITVNQDLLNKYVQTDQDDPTLQELSSGRYFGIKKVLYRIVEFSS